MEVLSDMPREYLWQGKYRTISEFDPALYYPNGIDTGTGYSSGYGVNEECYRLEFPLSPSRYFNNGSDFPRIVSPRVYFEQEDITDDPVWSFYLAKSNNVLCTGLTFSDPGFLIITGDFSPDMALDLDSGKLIGRTAEMDQYVSSLNIPADYRIDEQNYATVGSASYFRNGVGFGIPIRFTARVFSKSNPNIYIDKSFEYTLSNNWSSDRDYLILNLNNQFYVNGATATNLEYLQAQKAKGYFPGPPAGTTIRVEETPNLSTSPQFNYNQEPNPIWTATWVPPVSGTVAQSLAAENLTASDFTAYDYVKPMIWLTAPNSSSSYIDDSATQYFTKAASPGAYKTRLDAIINSLNTLPEGMRVLAPWYYWNAYVYYQNESNKRSDFASFVASNPDYNTYSGITGNGTKGIMIYNRKSDNLVGVYGLTGWTLASMWGLTAHQQIRNDWEVMCSGLKSRGALIDYIAFDQEGFPITPFDFDSSNARILQTIESLPQANRDWYGARSLKTILTQNGKYPNYTGLSAGFPGGARHPQKDPSYVYWNAAGATIRNASLNYCFYDVARQNYPNIGFSNYDSQKTNELDWVYDPYGHPTFQEMTVGDGASPYLYGSWNFSTSYVISPYDDTYIVRRDWNLVTEATSFFENSLWNCFLIDMQMVRGIRRTDPTAKLRPWIRPRDWQGDAGFVVGITSGQPESPSSGSRFYYEIVRHAAVCGAEHFYWWNTAVTGSQLTNSSMELNEVFTEINDLLGGFSPETATKERISFKSDYVISGTKAAGGRNWNRYVWRVTPKPGVTLRDEAGDILTVDSDGGKWLVTALPVAPIFYKTAIAESSGDWAISRYKDQYYVLINPAVADLNDPNGITWGNFTTDFVSYFQGKPRSGQGKRGFPWENNPRNPHMSSPWHNAIYESVVPFYRWGARSFHFHFAMGTYTFNESRSISGDVGVFFLSPQIWRDSYKYETPGVTHTNPARWKGWTGAINSLLSGTMVPVDETYIPQTSLSWITEPCNVCLYIPTNVSYYDYRRKASKYWRSLPGTTADKDTAYYSKLDGMLEMLGSMRPSGIGKGRLSVCLDVGSQMATPKSVELHRKVRDRSGSQNTVTDSSYISDALELSDYYVWTKLKEMGIDVFIEARPPKMKNQMDYGLGISSGPAGLTMYEAIGSEKPNITSTEHYFWTSNALSKTALPSAIAQFGPKDDMESNSEPAKIHRLNWQSFYMTRSGIYNDPYRAWTKTSIGGQTHDMWGYGGTNDKDNTYLTPHAATFYLYALADHHRHYNNLKNGNTGQFGVRLNNYNSIVFDATWFAYANKSVADANGASLVEYRRDLFTASPRTRTESGPRGPYPPWNGQTFDAVSWAAGPSAYYESGLSSQRYWTIDGRNFWTNNVMSDTFKQFTQMLDTFCATAAPVSGVAEGWTGLTYPYDFYTKNIIDATAHGIV
jgi:hypothetical protein